ncbi:MAG: DUF1570 domain-containing protein [Deltaproteobacteria bacterium]|nr:MAG: DUF1570 domain-containing protein [Deltaproteobacteria bacterium]
MKLGWGWAVSVLALVACAPGIPHLPSEGGPAWFEIRSEHFRLWTDDSVERGRKLVRDLERRREVIASAMGKVSSRATAFVISVRSARERAVYVPVEFVGVAYGPNNPTGQSGILINADYKDDDHVVSHELAHVVSLGWFANLPPWLNEGIATYFEMVDVDNDDTSVKIGIPRSDRGDILLRGRLVISVPELFACNERRCEDDTFYAASWAVVTLLLNEHYDQLARYLQRMNDLRIDTPATRWDGEPSDLPSEQATGENGDRFEQWKRGESAAWHDAFPDLPPEKLDAELTEWLRTGKVRVPRIDVVTREFPTTVRKLEDADVLAGRSWLRYRYTEDPTAALRDAQAALALDRTNVLARITAITLTHEIAPDDARATATAHPDDWRALRLVERALHGTSEGDAAIERLCAMSGGSAPECGPGQHRRKSRATER